MTEMNERPLSVAIMAVGGQGGGVLTKWLVDIAEANGFIAQSTFVAGVAQRTGATVYCVEMFSRERAEALGKVPVFTPYPVPGDVDLVVVGELAETGRAMQKGFVTPNITTLIASSHRIYSVHEKEALGDGIFDQAPVIAAAEKAAREFICFDMAAAADKTGSVISSVLLGAIAGAGALPFSRDAYENIIRESGRAVDASLRGFAAGFDGASGFAGQAPRTDTAPEPPVPAGPNGEALKLRIEVELPGKVAATALHGALRALDYQDRRYADAYLDRLKDIVTVDSASQEYALTGEVARQLALQMCYEDTIRVADLKTRPDRFRQIREQVRVAEDQPAHVVEYFHPRLEETCDTLPAPVGGLVLRSSMLRKMLGPLFRSGRNVTTTNLGGFLLLHLLAKLRRWRRGTFRYRGQQELIHDWLDNVINAAVNSDYDYALALARSIEIVRGYGDTYERGLTRYRAAVAATSGLPAGNRALVLRRLQSAALADEHGKGFREALAGVETIH